MTQKIKYVFLLLYGIQMHLTLLYLV